MKKNKEKDKKKDKEKIRKGSLYVKVVVEV